MRTRGMLRGLHMITRRTALKTVALASAVSPLLPTVGPSLSAGAAAAAAGPAGPHQLPPLGYAFDALEPFIDAKTMEIHHDRHHAAYVAGLNKAVGDQPALAGKSALELISQLDAVPDAIRTAVRNHGGGHVNHSFFWQLLKKNGGAGPGGVLKAAIEKKFGTVDAFRTEFTGAAMTVFGSGWAWLTVDRTGTLAIEKTPNQDSPYSAGRVPLLGIDVWEHAYYLKYQNKRADYVAAFFQVIDWDFVAARLAKPV